MFYQWCWNNCLNSLMWISEHWFVLLISYLQWRSAPPRSSAETSSPVAALTCRDQEIELKWNNIRHIPAVSQPSVTFVLTSPYPHTVYHIIEKFTNQRRSSEENGPLLPHDDAFICHRWYVCSSGSAGAHHNSYLKERPKKKKRFHHKICTLKMDIARSERMKIMRSVYLQDNLASRICSLPFD